MHDLKGQCWKDIETHRFWERKKGKKQWRRTLCQLSGGGEKKKGKN